jgi:hypothetical protein
MTPSKCAAKFKVLRNQSLKMFYIALVFHTIMESYLSFSKLLIRCHVKSNESRRSGKNRLSTSFWNDTTAQKTRSPTILLLLHVCLAAGTCLPSLCLAMKWGIHIQTHRLTGGIYEILCWDGFRYHDIYIYIYTRTPSFIKMNQAENETKLSLVWNLIICCS